MVPLAGTSPMAVETPSPGTEPPPFLTERLLRLQHCPASDAQDYAGHDDTVHLCRFSPSGRRLLTASHSAVLVWELAGPPGPAALLQPGRKAGARPQLLGEAPA